MGSFKKFSAQAGKKSKMGIIPITYKGKEKMQVRPLNDSNYCIEIKTANDKVKLMRHEVKILIEYLVQVGL